MAPWMWEASHSCVAADVQDDHRPVVADRFKVGEVRDRVAAQRLAARPLGRAASGGRGGAVDADPDQFALGLRDLLGVWPSRVSGVPHGISQPR